MKFTSLEDLSALKKKFPKKERVKRIVPKPRPKEEPEDPPKDDADLFARAMSEVTPISGGAKGREVPGESSFSRSVST